MLAIFNDKLKYIGSAFNREVKRDAPSRLQIGGRRVGIRGHGEQPVPRGQRPRQDQGIHRTARLCSIADPEGQAEPEGKNPYLVALGSYLVNAAGDCNGCHAFPRFLRPGGTMPGTNGNSTGNLANLGSNPKYGNPYLDLTKQSLTGQLKANSPRDRDFVHDQPFDPVVDDPPDRQLALRHLFRSVPSVASPLQRTVPCSRGGMEARHAGDSGYTHMGTDHRVAIVGSSRSCGQ